ncbi:hypothetical protein D1641_12485 [Colidextribacter sp. OB.20]|uniref:hypothetical protein n=1 Tax=Colidextribacter sp. OB.20 TaxID=2304568 RepID=UPI00136B14B6|nr:hypothetical protein [Colidextribacter sp. OB.20]NBI10824.1 hypothetical protein [Colidextribacter sp. OB.20]
MNQTILQILFLDNPEIPAEIASFCNSLPKYVQAEQEYNQAAQELAGLIGYEQFSRFEEALNWHLAAEARACYLFGLGLRQKLLRELAG